MGHSIVVFTLFAFFFPFFCRFRSVSCNAAFGFGSSLLSLLSLLLPRSFHFNFTFLFFACWPSSTKVRACVFFHRQRWHFSYGHYLRLIDFSSHRKRCVFFKNFVFVHLAQFKVVNQHLAWYDGIKRVPTRKSSPFAAITLNIKIVCKSAREAVELS